MIAGRLGCRIGAVRRIRGGLREGGLAGAERPVYLIRGNVQETESVPPFFGQLFPPFQYAAQEGAGSEDIGADKRIRVMDGAIHMALSGKIDDRIGLVMVQQLADEQRIPNIAPDKNMFGIPINGRQVTDISGIGELVEIDDPLPRGAPGQHIAGTDKPRASGYKNCLHSDTSRHVWEIHQMPATASLPGGRRNRLFPDNAPHSALDFFSGYRTLPQNEPPLPPKDTRTGHIGRICVQPRFKGNEAGTGSVPFSLA